MSSSAPGAPRIGDADSVADAWDVYRVAHLDALKVVTANAISCLVVPAVDQHSRLLHKTRLLHKIKQI